MVPAYPQIDPVTLAHDAVAGAPPPPYEEAPPPTITVSVCPGVTARVPDV
jgi:hypothetical protein